jgi:sigma54-dependent transcription regulator
MHARPAQELEEEMESAKQAWAKKQRSARDRSRGAQSKEVQALNRQLTAALQVCTRAASPDMHPSWPTMGVCCCDCIVME